MASSNVPPPMYQHHQLLIPHRGDDLLGAPSPQGALGIASLAKSPSPTSIYLQDVDDDDDDNEDTATSSFSTTSGGSHSSRPPSISLPTTPEGNEEEEEEEEVEVDCESALLELQESEDDDDDDSEIARQPIYSHAAAPSPASKVSSTDETKKTKSTKQRGRSGLLVNRRTRSRSQGYLHLSGEQNHYVDAVLAQEEALRHVRIVDTCVVAVGLLCLAPVLQAALVYYPAAGSSTGSSQPFYQSVGTQCGVVAVSQVALAMLYDTHSALLAFVGRMTLTVKLLNWAWLMFVLALPVGSILAAGGRSHFGYVVIIFSARVSTALMLWKVRSQPKAWKHDVAPRFPVMLRAFVDGALLVGALFLSLTTPGYLSALLLVAGPVVTRCLLVAFPGLSFD